MSTEQGQLRRWLATHPWVVRFVGLELLLLGIAAFGLVVLSEAFGGLLYAMAISLVVLVAVGASGLWVAQYVT